MKATLRNATLALFLIGSRASILAAGSQPPASPEVASAMQTYLDTYKLAGFIGIIADKTGRVHFKNVHGYANVEAKKPITEDNTFWIASMTKMFAGASIMMLVDEGFGHDGAYGTDLSVNPNTGLVAIFMVQCPGPDQWAARDLFLKTATEVFARGNPD